jgi:hypothetical protein
MGTAAVGRRSTFSALGPRRLAAATLRRSTTSLTRRPLPLRSAAHPFNPASEHHDRRGSQSHAAIGKENPRSPKTGAALRLLCAKRFGVRQLAAAFSPASLLAVLLSSRLPDGKGRLGEIPRASSREGKRQLRGRTPKRASPAGDGRRRAEGVPAWPWCPAKSQETVTGTRQKIEFGPLIKRVTC